jgi:hypothetical protein
VVMVVNRRRRRAVSAQTTTAPSQAAAVNNPLYNTHFNNPLFQDGQAPHTYDSVDVNASGYANMNNHGERPYDQPKPKRTSEIHIYDSADNDDVDA